MNRPMHDRLALRATVYKNQTYRGKVQISDCALIFTLS